MAIVRGFESVMSKVISFRLDPDNPREAKALDILREKQASGFSSRRILADALVALEDKKGISQALYVEEFNEILERIVRLLEKNNFETPGIANPDPVSSRPHALNDHFLQSVKVAVKPGINLEESNQYEQ